MLTFRCGKQILIGRLGKPAPAPTSQIVSNLVKST
ncbi:hypothetical protein NT07LI_4013, partial [Listeria innocua FSL S4-378]